MKKLILILALVMSMSLVAGAAEITLTVDIDKMMKVAVGFFGEIPTDKDGKPEYTDQEYVEKYLVEYCCVNQEQRFRKSASVKAVSEAKDNAVASVKK